MADNDNPLLGAFAMATEEPWSLEETQEKVLDKLKNILSSAKVDNKHLESISKNISVLAKGSRTAKSMDDQLQDILKTTKEEASLAEKLFKAFEKDTKSDKRFQMEQKSLLRDISDKTAEQTLGGRIGGADKTLGGLIGQVSSFTGSLREVTGVMGGLLGGIVGALAGVVANQVDAFRRMINVGESFTGSLVTMSVMSGQAGLSIQQMSSMVEKHATLVQNVGIKAVLDNQKAVRQLTYQFGNFGMTIDQITEFSASYLEQLKVSGQFERLNAQQRVTATATYLRNLTELAKITGKRREQIDSELKKTANSVDAFAARMFLGTEEQRKAFDQANDVMRMLAVNMGQTGENMLKGLYEGTLKGTIAINDQMKALLSAGGPIGEAARALDQAVANKDFEAAEKAAKSLQTAMYNASRDTEARTIAFRGMTGAQREQFRTLLEDMKRMGQQNESLRERAAKLGLTIEEVTDEERKRLEQGTQKALIIESQLAEAFGKLRAEIAENFGPALLKGVEIFSDTIDFATNNFGLFATGVGAAIGAFALIKKFLIGKFLGGRFGRAPGILARAQENAARRITAASRRMAGAMMGGGRGGGLGGRRGGRIGRMARGLGRGAGAVLGGAGGIAGGLIGGAGAAGKGLLSGAGKLLGGIGRVAGKAFLPLTAAMALYNAVGGYGRASENFGLKPGQKATTGQKLSSSAGSVLSGLSLGLIDEKTIAQGIGGLFGVGNKPSLAKATTSPRAGGIAATAATTTQTDATGTPMKSEAELLTSLNDKMDKMLKQLEMINSASHSTARSAKKSEPNPFGTDVIA